MKFSGRNRHLRQARNRYVQAADGIVNSVIDNISLEICSN
jgi:hypothetical protein